jgi:ribosomal protein L11 methyltransferase
MGFGTGHHATTRLCLAALQTLDLAGSFVVDVGTGSGILAIAAYRLGARDAMGIDSDPDAVRAAIENLQLNNTADAVRFRVRDLTSSGLPAADVVTANLTGALLRRHASLLMGLLRPSGTLIISGVQAEEREAVAAAFEAADEIWEASEEGWVGLMFRARSSPPP